MYVCIPVVITGESINRKHNKQPAFERYIGLSKKRNKVIHYSNNYNSEVYSKESMELVEEAPEIIRNLFEQYEKMGCTIKLPNWYAGKNLKPRIIK